MNRDCIGPSARIDLGPNSKLISSSTDGSRSCKQEQVPPHPAIALVIPCFGYSNFVPELMAGILSQDQSVPFVCVIVDDQDPEPNVAEFYALYADAHPEFIHYVRARRNGGLAASRNCGVDYVLARWPSVEVVMFPDADDRILPGYVRNSFTAFRSAKRKAESAGCKLGWVFEHPNMFGHPGRMLRLTRHSVLWNMVGATQMPSSAFSMELFRSGLRYETSFRWGGEDWDFSVGALEAGFVAAFGRHQGYLWRRRPGSMSALAAMDHNRVKVRLRHKALYQAGRVLAQAARENSYFALVTDSAGRLASTPSNMASLLDGQNLDNASLTPSGMAELLGNNVNIPADPCPQLFLRIGDEIGPALAKSPYWDHFVSLSNYFAGLGFVVLHRFTDLPAAAGIPTLSKSDEKTVGRADGAAVSLETFREFMRRPGELKRVIVMEWPLAITCGGHARGAGDAREAIRTFAEKVATSGVSPGPASRFGSEHWVPLGLTWRTLPAHHLGVNSSFVAPENSTRPLVICHASKLSDLAAHLVAAQEIDRQPLPGIALLSCGTIAGTSDLLQGLIERGLVRQLFPQYFAGDVVEANDFERIYESVIVSFGKVEFWSTFSFLSLLSKLKACGVRREIVFPRAESAKELMGRRPSSSFKAFDSYRILGEEGESRAVLRAYGVANEFIIHGVEGLWDPLPMPSTCDTLPASISESPDA